MVVTARDQHDSGNQATVTGLDPLFRQGAGDNATSFAYPMLGL